MRKEIFESEEEFEEVMRCTIAYEAYEETGSKEKRIYHAHKNDLIKKSELEQTKEDYYNQNDISYCSAGYKLLIKYKNALENELEKTQKKYDEIKAYHQKFDQRQGDD